MKMKASNDGLQVHRAPDAASKKIGTRDADLMLLFWESFRTRGNEIDGLIDLSLSIVSSAPDFEQKADLEASLKKALSLVRTIS